MASVSTCLKLIFTIFNIFFAIVGAVIVGFTLLFQVVTSINGGENLEGRSTVLILLYSLGGITMVIATLGAYGAHREKRACLIVFLVCMVIGSLMMLRAGVTAIYSHSQGGRLEEHLRDLLPLDRAPEDIKVMANRLQTQLHCCGLFSYSDWEDNVPSSCLCDPETERGECQTLIYAVSSAQSRKSIYAKSCFPIIARFFGLIRNILVGVYFALAALALLGMALSSTIIHQMRYPGRSTILMTVPAIFTLPPPKYQELHNPPEY